jgi:hypothetical protein
MGSPSSFEMAYPGGEQHNNCSSYLFPFLVPDCFAGRSALLNKSLAVNQTFIGLCLDHVLIMFGRVIQSAMDLATLLSQPLVAFTIEVDNK